MAYTEGEWGYACDSYGKVLHSRKSCVYTKIKGKNGDGDRLVTIAARMPSLADARLMAAAKELYAALKYMNHDSELGNGYCVCPLKDGTRPDTDHATSCLDARLALRKVESNHADWRNDTQLRS